QLRQDVWLAGRRRDSPHLALPVVAHGLAGSRHQRAGGKADPEGLHGGTAAANGTARRASRRHAWRKHRIGRAPMDRSEEIDRLNSRLHWDSGGPLAHLADQAADAFASRVEALLAWVRERAEERP